MKTLGGEDTSATATQWRFSLVLGLIVTIGAAVRISLLDQIMRHDEVLTLSRYAVDISSALTDYSAPNNHILHSVLVSITTSLFGDGLWAMRLPALLFGLGLIVATDWWISSSTSNQRAGLLAAGLVAGSSVMIEYATLARGYTMVAVGFVVLMEMGRRLLEEPTLRRWSIWIAVSVAGFLTVPVFAFPFAAAGGWLLLNLFREPREKRRTVLRSLIGASAAVVLLTVIVYIPAALTSGVDSIVANDFVQPLSWSDLPEHWWGLAQGIWSLFARDLAVIYVVFATMAVILNRAIFGRYLTPALSLVGPGIVTATLRVSPPQRVWLFVWPLVLGLAGAGIAMAIDWAMRRSEWRSAAVSVLAIGLALIMGTSTLASGEVLRSREGGTFRDVEAATDLLLEEINASDRIVVESHPRVILDHYMREEGWSGSQLERDFEDAERLFVVVYHPRPQDLSGVLEQAGAPRTGFDDPTLMWRLPETSIYLMQRES